MKPALLLLGLILLAGLPRHGVAWAADVSARVDRTSMAAGESLGLSVTVAGEGDAEVDVSAIQDFSVRSAGTSTSLKIVNGRASREVSYRYRLTPNRTGRLTVPALTVRVGDEAHRTRPIRITVTDQPQDRAGDDREVFVEAELSNAGPYAGEGTVYTFRLIRSVRIANVSFKAPEFDGFSAQAIGDERDYTRTIDGRPYNVTELSWMLMPLEAGVQRIPPAVLRCDVVRRRRGGGFGFSFDGFFGNADLSPRTLRTEAKEVTVRPLPPYEGDVPFSGLVGRFDLAATLDTSDLTAGDSATLSVTISGRGNIMEADTPAVELPDGIKRYADAPEEQIRLNREGYLGEKIFRMALVPVEAGQYTIGPIRLAYFDVEAERYRIREANPMTLTARPGADTASRPPVVTAPDAGQEPDKQTVELTGRDVLPLKDDLDALADRGPVSLPVFLSVLLAPAAIFGLLAGWRRVARRADRPSRRMARRANNALKMARRKVKDDPAFLTDLYRALISAIHARTGGSGATLTGAEAKARLGAADCDETTVQAAVRHLEAIESARFGGRPLDAKARQALLDDTAAVVRRLLP